MTAKECRYMPFRCFGHAVKRACFFPSTKCNCSVMHWGIILWTGSSSDTEKKLISRPQFGEFVHNTWRIIPASIVSNPPFKFRSHEVRPFWRGRPILQVSLGKNCWIVFHEAAIVPEKGRFFGYNFSLTVLKLFGWHRHEVTMHERHLDIWRIWGLQRSHRWKVSLCLWYGIWYMVYGIRTFRYRWYTHRLKENWTEIYHIRPAPRNNNKTASISVQFVWLHSIKY